jgi:hypothetical protein
MAPGAGTPGARTGKDEASFAKTIVQPTSGKVKGAGIPVYDHGREIGYIRGDVLHRKMQGSRSILQKPPAIALGMEALRQAVHAEVKTVWIQDTESGLEYRADIWEFNSLHAFDLNRGYGEQRALPLQYWTITDPKHPEKQLSLLEVGA